MSGNFKERPAVGDIKAALDDGSTSKETASVNQSANAKRATAIKSAQEASAEAEEPVKGADPQKATKARSKRSAQSKSTRATKARKATKKTKPAKKSKRPSKTEIAAVGTDVSAMQQGSLLLDGAKADAETTRTRKSATKNEAGAKAPSYLGHRQRLRDRFAQDGGKSMPEYEFLELLLFRSMPRRDTKPIAKQLIEEFGSFAEVINASTERLQETDHIGLSVIADFRLIRAASLRLMRGEIMQKPVLGSWDAVLDYCHAAMAFEACEQFRILFLDKRNRLIADEVQQQGTVDHTPVYVREVIKRALELSATAIILAHNHPSGDPTPSRADIEMTKLIVDAARNLSIVIHDHIIIGKDGGYSSMKALRLI